MIPFVGVIDRSKKSLASDRAKKKYDCGEKARYGMFCLGFI
jgi:hypothetical protein